MRSRLVAIGLVVLVGSTGSACGGDEYPSDYRPEKIDGSRSDEFEPDDIESANNASGAVKDYCSGAVSEAQRIGCEAHVTEDEIP